MKQDYFDDLIRRYKAHELTQEELEIFASWLESIDMSSDKVIWTSKNRDILKKKIKRRLELKTSRYLVWRQIASVAAVLLFVSIVGYIWYQIQRPQPLTNEDSLALNPIVPAQSKGVLYHEGGDKIQLDNLKNDTIYRFDNLIVERIADNEIRILPQHDGQEIRQYIEAPKGGNFVVQLEDGSRLTLNANSSISFPTSFAASHRTVETRGEVFFDVKKDNQERPFIVKAGETSIRVLGTQFNVLYKEGTLLKTALFEGKVLVTNPRFEVQLKPGKELTVKEGGDYAITTFAEEQVGAWKEGYFSLENKNIAQIMEEVGDWYNVEIVYVDVDLGVRYHGTVSKFSDIETLLDILSLAKGNTFEIKGRRIIVR